jgi:hypothetical protein
VKLDPRVAFLLREQKREALGTLGPTPAIWLPMKGLVIGRANSTRCQRQFNGLHVKWSVGSPRSMRAVAVQTPKE